MIGQYPIRRDLQDLPIGEDLKSVYSPAVIDNVQPVK